MSSRSICEFVGCSHLSNSGCSAYGDPEKYCPIGNFGFLRDDQIFQNIHHFDKMGEIYRCIYVHLVQSVLSKYRYIEGLKSEIANNLSHEEQTAFGLKLAGLEVESDCYD